MSTFAKRPLSVGTTPDKPWSSHLATCTDAIEHRRLAIEAGVDNPRIFDGDKEDITEKMIEGDLR